DSTFSERNYGASSFLDFVEKLAQTGVVTLKHAGRSVMVELNEPTAAEGEVAAKTEWPTGHPEAAEYREPRLPSPPIQQPTESTADGVARASRILASAKNARWPMYLRNVKQILRQHRGDASLAATEGTGFDERRYGFGGLLDLLRALQRDGFVRLERDRRGG